MKRIVIGLCALTLALTTIFYTPMITLDPDSYHTGYMTVFAPFFTREYFSVDTTKLLIIWAIEIFIFAFIYFIVPKRGKSNG